MVSQIIGSIAERAASNASLAGLNARLENTQIPLHIMATNWQRFGVGLSTGPAVEAILASTPIPGIFPPAEIEGEP
jgi:predicted acylesterase/phospholipase RssA